MAQPASKRLVTEAAAAASYLPKWKPATDYTSGQAVVNPSGDVVTAKAAFTSGATYDASQWNLSPTYVSALVGPDGSVSLYQNGVEL